MARHGLRCPSQPSSAGKDSNSTGHCIGYAALLMKFIMSRRLSVSMFNVTMASARLHQAQGLCRAAARLSVLQWLTAHAAHPAAGAITMGCHKKSPDGLAAAGIAMWCDSYAPTLVIRYAAVEINPLCVVAHSGHTGSAQTPGSNCVICSACAHPHPHTSGRC